MPLARKQPVQLGSFSVPIGAEILMSHLKTVVLVSQLVCLGTVFFLQLDFLFFPLCFLRFHLSSFGNKSNLQSEHYVIEKPDSGLGVFRVFSHQRLVLLPQQLFHMSLEIKQLFAQVHLAQQQSNVDVLALQLGFQVAHLDFEIGGSRLALVEIFLQSFNLKTLVKQS